MRKTTKEIFTLTTAIVGAVTGIASLSWQVYFSVSAKKEDLKVLFVPHVDDAAVIHPTVYITNMSRGDVYLREIQIQLHPPRSKGVWLKDETYIAPGEEFLSWSADGITSTPEPFDQPIKPKQERKLELKRVHYKSEEGFRSDFIEEAASLIVKTTTGQTFESRIPDWERANTKQEIEFKLKGKKTPNPEGSVERSRHRIVDEPFDKLRTDKQARPE